MISTSSTAGLARAATAAAELRPRGSLSRRLFVAFGSLIVLFAAAAAATLTALAQIGGGLEQLGREEDGVRRSLELASAVRDQYAHQAHTVILGNLTHLGFYGAAVQRVHELTREVRALTATPEEGADLDAIERMSRSLDEVFTQSIVPAVIAGDRETVQAGHARAIELVTSIQGEADRLAGRFQAAIDELRARVGRLELAVRRATIAFLVGAPLAAALVALFMGRSVTRPVALLVAGSNRLAQGDLDTRIELERDDELGVLAREFNRMTTALREHQQRLVQSEKLAGVGRLAAGVAHEINNPLGVILGYARVLKKSAQGSLADDLGVIEEEVLRAREIVEGLLDLARPPRLASERVDLRELCDDVGQRLLEAGAVASARLEVLGGGVAQGDQARLRQIVLNLVKNAVEAAGSEGSVRVTVEARAGSVAVVVCDDGPGIGAEARAKLFEPFFTTKQRGTGLGLAVSRAIARAHGGDLELVDGAGPGACFVLSLPPAAEGT